MKKSLVITTINKPNNNIKLFSKYSKKNKWDFIVIGDRKTPKNFKIKYGNYFDLNSQKKLIFKFSKKCPKNNYARKNIGYLISIKNKYIMFGTLSCFFNGFGTVAAQKKYHRQVPRNRRPGQTVKLVVHLARTRNWFTERLYKCCTNSVLELIKT